MTAKKIVEVVDKPVETKNKLLNAEITEQQASELKNIELPPEFKGKKLYCRVWNEKGTRTLARPKKIPYGMPYFTTKIGGKNRFFKVNYYTDGMIQNIEGKMYYNIAFDNTVGGFALRNHEFPEDMASDEVYTAFVDNGLQMYVKKGGLPMIYFAIAMIVALVCVIAVLATVPAGLGAQENVKVLDAQVTALKGENLALRAENQILKSTQQNGDTQ